MSAIRFLLNGVPETLENPPFPQTVLNWLRYRRRLTGTKEGCAEGDCGACTVVIARLIAGQLHFRAVNACILFLPVLHGAALFTAEGLAGPNGELHPVQQAMVDHHGSQCGFCTPGFVMSLYAAHRGHSNESATNLIAGNLCRCTGYGPIIAAALEQGSPPPWQMTDSDLVSAIENLGADGPVELAAGGKYFAPTSISELTTAAAADPHAVLLAGGTDVGLWVTKGHKDLPSVISVTSVPELQTIDDAGPSLTIGAAVTYTDAQSAFKALHPDLGELFRRIGSIQIRNSGTIGGNIANGSPIGDTMPALIALGATVVLRHGDIERTLPLEDFYLGYKKQDRKPGEVLVSVIVPKPPRSRWFRTIKISKRFEQDISAVCMGLALDIENDIIVRARLAYGGMAAIPSRAPMAEAALTGQLIKESTFKEAMKALPRDFAPISDARASAIYRLRVAKTCC